MSKRKNIVDKIGLHLILGLLALCCIYPILLIVSISITENNSIYELGYRLIPQKINFISYEYILKTGKQLFNSYFVSAKMIIVGGFLSVTVTALLAYPLSRLDFKHRNKITFYVVITMLFNGGMVPWYMLIVNNLHLKDSFWVLILPYVVLGWYVLLLRTFFKSIPLELIESASIDGASEYSIFFRIILPLSKAGIASISFLTVLRYWNDWWLPMLFIENDNLVPLQYLLYRMMSNLEEIKQAIAQGYTEGLNMADFPSESARMAMCVLAAGPMLFVFPFFQKYFVKGVNVGAVKG